MKIPRIGAPKNLRPAGIHIEPKRREHRESQQIQDGLDEFATGLEDFGDYMDPDEPDFLEDSD